MRTLYLLRHGKAERAAGPGFENDFERPLAGRGKSDAALMGRVLRERAVFPGAVYCSTALRARQTIEIIAPLIGLDSASLRFEDGLYLAPAEVLADFIAALDPGPEAVLLCGHNSGLEDVAAFFLGRGLEKFPTCAFREIRFNAESWAGAGPGTVQDSEALFPGMFREK
jgi:phosphohistidine phosphatase